MHIFIIKVLICITEKSRSLAPSLYALVLLAATLRVVLIAISTFVKANVRDPLA